MDKDNRFPDYDYRSLKAARRRARDARILNRISLSRDFHWIVEILFAPRGKEVGLRWMLHALIRVVGKDALQKEVQEQCKKDSGGQERPIPGAALRAQILIDDHGMKRSPAVREAIGAPTTDPGYQPVYDAVKNHASELRGFLKILNKGDPGPAMPSDITTDPEELRKRRP